MRQIYLDMEIYSKRSFLYVGAVTAITASVLYFRSDRYSESTMWDAAVTSREAAKYRDYCRNWRNGANFTNAVRELEKAIVRDYKELDFLSPRTVRNFINGYPEIHPSQVIEDQHAALLNADEYKTYLSFYNNTTSSDKYHDEIGSKIDELIKREVDKAIAANDYKRLANLAIEYEDWKTVSATIRSKINGVKAEAAKHEWVKLSTSRSEQALRRFASDYSGTMYAGLATSRIDALYSDFDFIKSKDALVDYYQFVVKHPNSEHASEAWGYISAELRQYVFRGKKASASTMSTVRKALESFKKPRPNSGLIVGAYGQSPFKIVTPYGAEDYYLKLVNKSSGEEVGVYVRGGETTEVYVANGTYELRYATGKTWYGTKLLFGFDTHVQKSSQRMTFWNGEGHALTLQKVRYGNFSTREMSPSDF